MSAGHARFGIAKIAIKKERSSGALFFLADRPIVLGHEQAVGAVVTASGWLPSSNKGGPMTSASPRPGVAPVYLAAAVIGAPLR